MRRAVSGMPRSSFPKLRATQVSVNFAARELGIVLFRNIRVPEESVIAKVANGTAEEASDVENLARWEAAGKHLNPLPFRVHARRTYGRIEALMVPILADERVHGRRRAGFPIFRLARPRWKVTSATQRDNSSRSSCSQNRTTVKPS